MTVVLVPDALAKSVKNMSIPMASKIVAKYAIKQKRKNKFKKVISELRSFQCDTILTKKQLKEVVLILKECGITESDFEKLMDSFIDYPYEGWYHKLKQAKDDERSGLYEYFMSLNLRSMA